MTQKRLESGAVVRRERPARLAILVLALALGACGCSGGSGSGHPRNKTAEPSAATLTADIVHGFRTVQSVRISGRVPGSGYVVSFDLAMLRAGQMSGTIAEQALPLTVIVTGQAAYVKITAAVLKYRHDPPSVCKLVCGKYFLAPPSLRTRLLHGLSLATLASGLAAHIPPLTEDGTAVKDGQKVYVLLSPVGDIFYVRAAGAHYLVATVSGNSPAELHFSQWNEVPVPAPPPPGQIVNFPHAGSL
jgi:hypothetical protein